MALSQLQDGGEEGQGVGEESVGEGRGILTHRGPSRSGNLGAGYPDVDDKRAAQRRLHADYCAQHRAGRKPQLCDCDGPAPPTWGRLLKSKSFLSLPTTRARAPHQRMALQREASGKHQIGLRRGKCGKTREGRRPM